MSRPTFGLAPALALLLSLIPAPAWAQGLEFIQANYTKYEYRIPMRDGVKLFTAVYVPKDTTVQKYPILLTRTPYGVGPYGTAKFRPDLGPSALFGKEGYIFVYQDVRGRWMSEGTHVNMRPHNPSKKGTESDESSDTYDTIDWLLKNVTGHNGKVGQWGISYPGFYTTCGMIDAHPALVASSPQAPITDWFIGDDFHHNGCFFLPHCFNFMAVFGQPREGPVKKASERFDHGTPDGYQFFLDMGSLANADTKYLKGKVAFWKELMEHGTYDDFWQARNLRPHIKNIKPAVLTVGGFFDAENLFGALETFKAVDRDSSSTKRNTLVMGPWLHGGWNRDDCEKLGDIHFGQKTPVFYREQIEFPFFQMMLKGKGDHVWPRAWVFETGTNQWRKYDTWPPEGKAQSFYLAPSGKLKDQPVPADKNAPGYDEYLADPNRPVPSAEKITNVMPGDYMIHDQRFASRRPDVLTYTSPELEADMRLAGPVEVELHVATSGTDSDFIVKLIDVFPNDYPEPDPKNNPGGVRLAGYQMLVRGEPFRGKFRNSFSKPEPFKPNEPTVIKFTMPDVNHVFRSGHKVMVQVQSSWFPMVDRNPQTFCDIYAAKESDFVKATQRVYHAGDRTSRVTVRVVK